MAPALDPDALRDAVVAPHGPWLDLEHHSTIGSTNRRAAALGMKIAAHDPFVADADPAWTPAYGPVQRRDLATLIAESDVLSLHVPLTAETPA